MLAAGTKVNVALDKTAKGKNTSRSTTQAKT